MNALKNKSSNHKDTMMYYIRTLTIAMFLGCSILNAMEPAPCAILQHKTDRYKGVIIDIAEKPKNFADSLQYSLDAWKKEGKRGIWLSLLLAHADLVPVAVNQGFIYHHATAAKLVLVKWLAEQEECKLPSYATRTAGISALVIDENNRILVVREKYNKEWGYKMPSGAVEMGENFKDAAIRETKEETGIDTVFAGVVAWWERHNTRMDGVSDLFFLCRLRALNTTILKQDSEVSEALWMPLEKFKEVATGPQKEFIAALETAGNDYSAYEVPDFSGKGMMTYYARPGANIK